MWHKRSLLAVCPFSTSWRIVLGERIAGSALSQTKHIIPMLLTCIIQLAVLHREVWPINTHHWLDTQYTLRVLHFSAIVFDVLCSL